MRFSFNSWNIIFTMLAGVTGFFTLAGLHDLTYLDKDLSKNIALILIPITAGGIVTKFTTNSWQITKEKISIKQNILSDYEKSYKLIANLTDSFVYKIVESHIVYKYAPAQTVSQVQPVDTLVAISPPSDPDTILLESYTHPELAIYAYLQFPNYGYCPNNIFSADADKLRKKIESAAIIQNRFLSKLRLYFEGDLTKEVNSVKDILDIKSDIAQRLLASKNPKELSEYFGYYAKNTDKSKEIIRAFETKLVSLKFRKINL